MDTRKQSRRAGIVRVAFALAALTFSDTLFPNIPAALIVICGYLAISLGFQLAIDRGWGAGDTRSLAMGVVDIAFLSYVVHLQGPASSALPFAYLLIPVINASASSTRSRVAMRLAGIGSVAYTTLIAMAALHLYPYAPARPEIGGQAPALPVLVASGSLVVMSLLVTTNLVLRQVVALNRANAQLRELSQRDELTQLYNRRHLLQEVRRELARVGRGGSVGLMMIDLDGFKSVNDRHGHEAGDQLLVDVGRVLVAETRNLDLVARYGGDEFVVLLPDLGDSGARPVAERVVRAVAEVGRRMPNTPVSASVGLAMASAEDDVSSLIRRADEEAYAAKRAGGNRLSVARDDRLSHSGIQPSQGAHDGHTDQATRL